MSSENNQLIESVRESFEKCLAIIERKNHDYAGAASLDLYANFRTAELLGISVEKGIMVRWLDKLKRIDNLLSQEAYVTDESIEDTLRDAINYPAILLAYLQESKKRSGRK